MNILIYEYIMHLYLLQQLHVCICMYICMHASIIYYTNMQHRMQVVKLIITTHTHTYTHKHISRK